MTEENNKQLAAVHPGQLPAYLEDFDGDDGSSSMDKYVQPPFLKVVQAQSEDLQSQGFKIGTVLLSPANVPVLVEPGDKFHFVPIFCFTEFQLRAPLGSPVFILDRSYDPASELGRVATDPDFAKRKMTHETLPGKTCEAVETINYIVVGMDGAVAGVTILMTFAKAEHKVGRALVSLIKMRRGGKRIPQQSMVFAAVKPAKARKNDQGSWHGYDVANPSDHEPFVQDTELFQQFRGLYEQFAEDFAKGLLKAAEEEVSASQKHEEEAAAAAASTGKDVNF